MAGSKFGPVGECGVVDPEYRLLRQSANPQVAGMRNLLMAAVRGRASIPLRPISLISSTLPGIGKRRLLGALVFGIVCLLAPPLAHAQFDACYGPFNASTMPVDPNDMDVSNKPANRHVVTGNPDFSWVTAPGVVQQNWHVQVDSAPDFNGHGGNIWFWDSGQVSKGGLETTSRFISLGAANAPGSSPRAIDTRASLIYWRIRILDNGVWSGWSCSFFKRNQVPWGNESMGATIDGNPGAIPSVANFPALVTSTQTFYVSPSGSNSNSGTSGSPFRTIDFGTKALNPGDTLIVKNGTYSQNIRLHLGSGGVQNGQAGNPITITAENAGGAILRSVQSGPTPWIPLELDGVDYWIVDGLKIGGSSSAIGIQITSGEFVTMKNLSFESGFNTNGIGVRLWGGGRGNRVLDSVFDTRMFDQVEVLGSRHPEIRGNEFTGVNGHVAIHYHNSGSQGGTVSDNVFHDFTSTEGAIFLYLAADGTTVRNNIIYGVSSGFQAFDGGVLIMRCGKILVENNTFVRNTRGVAFLEYSRYNVVRNNIFVGNTTALDFSATQSAEPGATALGTILENNLTFGNGQDVFVHYGSDRALINGVLSGSNALDPAFGNLVNMNPLFVNLDPSASSPYSSNDLHLQSGSPARNMGKGGIPVPFGGGGTIDIGAFEFGTGTDPPYDYTPVVVGLSDSTPKITFGYIDRDLDLAIVEPLAVPDISNERPVGIELEIDSSNRFDSVGGNRPVFSTGQLLTPNPPTSFPPEYTVPDANALPPGLYYVRIRQRDGNQGWNEAGWSSNNFRIQIGAGSPILSQQDPAPGALGVDPNVTVTAHVTDFTSGVDPSSIVVTLGVNDPSAPTAVAGLSVVPVGGQVDDILITFMPAATTTISANDVLTVRVLADSLNAGSPSMDSSWSFTVADSTPPPAPANFMVIP